MLLWPPCILSAALGDVSSDLSDAQLPSSHAHYIRVCPALLVCKASVPAFSCAGRQDSGGAPSQLAGDGAARSGSPCQARQLPRCAVAGIPHRRCRWLAPFWAAARGWGAAAAAWRHLRRSFPQHSFCLLRRSKDLERHLFAPLAEMGPLPDAPAVPPPSPFESATGAPPPPPQQPPPRAYAPPPSAYQPPSAAPFATAPPGAQYAPPPPPPPGKE